MAGQGYDSITIDTQHGMIGFEPMLAMLQAMRFSPATLLVRVPWLDPAPIMQALDAGAYGIICPMINSRAEAERMVSYVRYPPKGERSFGPTRANYTAGSGYAAEANDEILCFAMVETAEAVANLADIVATPGLDGIYIGPADLSFSLSEGRLTPGFRQTGARDDRGHPVDRRCRARPGASAPACIMALRITRQRRRNGGSTC